MEATHKPTFDEQLHAAKTKASGKLKTGDIKRLLNAAGKRPTETQTKQVAELIASFPDNQVLVYELLGDLEISGKPNPKVVLLKSPLWRIVETWLSSPPPVGQDLEPVLTWLHSQIEHGEEDTPVSNDRLRGVLLWLIAQHRSPDLFLKSLRAIGPLVSTSLKPTAKQKTPKREPQTGFVVAGLARAVFIVGKGRHPRLTRLIEVASTIETVLTYLQEREAAADAAIEKLEKVETALVEQRRINSEQTHTIDKLVSDKTGLQTQVATLTAEVIKWKQSHKQAIDHTNSQVAEGKKALLTNLQSKILSKLGDARLYANRPNPAVDQVLRLIVEVEQVLQPKEGQL